MEVAAKQASMAIEKQLEKLKQWKKDIQTSISATDVIIQCEYKVISFIFKQFCVLTRDRQKKKLQLQ